MSDIEMDSPKYRIAVRPLVSKRAGSKIVKGELRVGTNTLFNRDEEMRWYMAWRHCAESQEQLKLAFEEGRIADKNFKSIRPDLASAAPLSNGFEITDAEDYKHDINALKSCYEQDDLNSLDDLDTISDTFKQTVLETLRTGERVDVTKEGAPAAKSKKARANEPKVENRDSSADEALEPTRPCKRRPVEEVEALSDAEPEYVPKKSRSRSRSKPKEKPVDPAVAKIEAMATAMRDKAALG
ncbi:hypothetical protein N0V86_000523 [Didymella sp. IMI 355093]|nr:hypothetical protein N0V86_000523 [Didymella sp. IMI 355093]